MKTCSKCNVSKPLSGFNPHFCPRRKIVAHRGECRACANLYQKERNAKGRKTQCPIKAREYQLKRVYGITPEDYALMLEQQDNNCFICLTPAKTPTSLHVDHNHVTGEVRSLLCQNCNTGLGQFKDDPTVLARAITYLLEKGDYSEPQSPLLSKINSSSL